MEFINIKFKKLHPDAEIPSKAHASDAGFDLKCVSVEMNNGIVVCHTGLSIELPLNYVALIFPRSSIYKYDLIQTNSVGVVDSGYRGEVIVKFRIAQPFSKSYSAGERIAQIVIIPYPNIVFKEVDQLSDSDRDGGFGSTGE